MRFIGIIVLSSTAACSESAIVPDGWQPESGTYLVAYASPGDCSYQQGSSCITSMELTIDSPKLHIVGERLLGQSSDDYYCHFMDTVSFVCDDLTDILDLKNPHNQEAVLIKTWGHSGVWTTSRRFESVVTFSQFCDGDGCEKHNDHNQDSYDNSTVTDFIGNLY